MKRVSLYFIVGLMCMALSGCGKDARTDAQPEGEDQADVTVTEPEDIGITGEDDELMQDNAEPDVGQDEEDAEPTDEEDAELTDEEWLAQTQEYEQVFAEERSKRREAYHKVILDILQKRLWPDGSTVESDGPLRNNSFSICDIDGDEIEELLIVYTTTYTAGQQEIIYEYNLETGELRTEFVGFPYILMFCDNGLIIEGASHNHSMSMDFWPYRMHCYRPEEDRYEVIAVVAACDKEYAGEEFPEEYDLDGNGVVYGVSEGDDYPEDYTMDDAEYDAWYRSWINDYVAELEILWLPLEEASFAEYLTEGVQDSAQQTDDDPQSVQAQLALIADHVDEWAISADYADDVYEYAVTDLDGNGRLEMIAAHMGGTGCYTYSNFYEVNEGFDGLYLCERDVQEGESQIDLGNEDITAYYDGETGAVYYLFCDYIKNSATEYYDIRIAVSLQDGKLSEVPLAMSCERYTQSGGSLNYQITYQDAEGQELTEEEYFSYADEVFSGMEKKEVQFMWCVYLGPQGAEDLRNLSYDDLLAALTQSYEGFCSFSYFRY